MHDPAGRDATVVRKALSGDVIDLQVATEVICSRTSSQIQVFKQVYYAKYGLHLENDIDYQASGDHRKVTSTFFFVYRSIGENLFFCQIFPSVLV